jgi:cysteine desulfurase
MSQKAYLDYNATAPIRPEVIAAMAAALATPGNPSSVHSFGRNARRQVENARAAVAALIGVRPREIIFTSGGTEANNLALRGSPALTRLVSAVEHDSVLAPAAALAGAEPPLAVDGNGVVDLAALETRLAGMTGPVIVSVMLVNNETGIIQPVAEIARLAHSYGAYVHCDAIQAAGRLPLDCVALGIDMMTITAHKLGGPPGAGALAVRDGVPLKADLLGGGHELRRRAGTENVPGIVGFGVAATVAAQGLAAYAGLAALRDRLEQALREAAPGTIIHGAGTARVANTSCISMPGVPAETQLMALDLAGIAASAGSACSSGKVKPSHVLAAMDVPEDIARTALRFSLGWASTAAEIELAIAAWVSVWQRAGTNKAA